MALRPNFAAARTAPGRARGSPSGSAADSDTSPPERVQVRVRVTVHLGRFSTFGFYVVQNFKSGYTVYAPVLHIMSTQKTVTVTCHFTDGDKASDKASLVPQCVAVRVI